MRSIARALVFTLVVALCGGFGFGVQAQSHTHDHSHHHDHNHTHQFDYSGYEVKSQRSRIHTEWGIGVGGVYTIAEPIVTESVAAAGLSLAPRIGFQGHLDMAVCFGRFVALEMKIYYSGGSIDVATKYDEHRVRTSTVDIPLLLSLRAFNGRLRVNAGPMFTVLAKGEYTDSGEVMMFGGAAPSWALTAGISVGLGRHFLIDARYIYSAKNRLNQFGGSPQSPGLEFETRYDRVMAGVTILF